MARRRRGPRSRPPPDTLLIVGSLAAAPGGLLPVAGPAQPGGPVGAEAGEEMPELVVNPWRPGRSEPRCKKRRPKQFDLMRVPRAELRKRLREKDLAA